MYGQQWTEEEPMELTLARRVGATLAATGLAFGMLAGVLAGVEGFGHRTARSVVADTSADADLITEVTFPKVAGDGEAARAPAVGVLAEPAEAASHDHGPENFQTK
jgi:hypothetical protein